jgi:hypothetical protein
MRQPNADIARQINLIAPGLYPRWDPRREKWIIAKNFPRRVRGVTEYDPLSGKNYVVELILEDERGRFIELDSRVVEFIRVTIKEKEKFYGPGGFSVEKFCNAMGDEERLRVVRARRYRHEAVTELFKKIWKFKTQKTFVYGG